MDRDDAPQRVEGSRFRLTWISLTYVLAAFQLLLLTAVSTAAAPSENPALDVAAYFRGGCPVSLSEGTFRTFFTSVGASVKDISQPDNPISVGASFAGRSILATYYRSPFKCCVSYLGTKAERVDFVGWMMQELSLRDPKLLQEGKRKMLLFAPEYSNRAVTIDWDNDRTSDRALLNLCRSEYPDVPAVHGQLPAIK